MGVYQHWIVPRLIDLAMRNRLLDYYRQRTIEPARGLVLEVGVGSGLNLRFYSRDIRGHPCMSVRPVIWTFA
jgi:hypothetical protein